MLTLKVEESISYLRHIFFLLILHKVDGRFFSQFTLLPLTSAIVLAFTPFTLFSIQVLLKIPRLWIFSFNKNKRELNWFSEKDSVFLPEKRRSLAFEWNLLRSRQRLTFDWSNYQLVIKFLQSILKLFWLEEDVPLYCVTLRHRNSSNLFTCSTTKVMPCFSLLFWAMTQYQTLKDLQEQVFTPQWSHVRATHEHDEAFQQRKQNL